MDSFRENHRGRNQDSLIVCISQRKNQSRVIQVTKVSSFFESCGSSFHTNKRSLSIQKSPKINSCWPTTMHLTNQSSQLPQTHLKPPQLTKSLTLRLPLNPLSESRLYQSSRESLPHFNNSRFHHPSIQKLFKMKIAANPKQWLNTSSMKSV